MFLFKVGKGLIEIEVEDNDMGKGDEVYVTRRRIKSVDGVYEGGGPDT